MKPHLLLPGMALLCLLAGPAAYSAAPASTSPTITLKVGSHLVEVERAATAFARQRGLMYRTSLPDNGGMLFDFDEADFQCFWMKNTLIPLSIAFIAGGRIVDIQSMAPLSTTPHCSPVPVDHALELHEGWFDRHGVGIGTDVAVLP